MIECSYKSESAIGRALSNLEAYHFILDGKEYASVEGFLQSLKSENNELHKLHGIKAWKQGQKLNDWKQSQTLYYLGQEFDRHSDFYKVLLIKMYDAVYDQCPAFRDALVLSKGAELYHNGKTDPTDSVLVVDEYIRQLERLRNRRV
jgi:hypothetical protein